MSDFRPLSQSELSRLSPEELIAYHHEARRLFRHDEARTALGILIWGFQDRVRYWVSRTVPSQDVPDVVSSVFESALKSSFEGTQPGQFGAWLREISHRRATDYHRAAERRPSGAPLPDEHEGEEDFWGAAGWTPDPTEAVVARSVSDQAVDELGEVHRRVIELAGPVELGFDGRPAKETAEMISDQFDDELDDPMTNGYSLPGIDIEAEKLFERSMTKNGAAPRVDVVNPAPASAARFAGVAGGRPLRWYPTAGSFLNTDALS
jgi:DNA-directed RNA polymerase specialized sigma24 family protein